MLQASIAFARAIECPGATRALTSCRQRLELSKQHVVR